MNDNLPEVPAMVPFEKLEIAAKDAAMLALYRTQEFQQIIVGECVAKAKRLRAQADAEALKKPGVRNDAHIVELVREAVLIEEIALWPERWLRDKIAARKREEKKIEIEKSKRAKRLPSTTNNP